MSDDYKDTENVNCIFYWEKQVCVREGDFKVNPTTKTHSPSQSSQLLEYALPSVHSKSEWTPGAYIPTDHQKKKNHLY